MRSKAINKNYSNHDTGGRPSSLQLSPLDLVGTICYVLQRWRPVALFAIIGLCFGVGASFLVPLQYRGEALLYVGRVPNFEHFSVGAGDITRPVVPLDDIVSVVASSSFRKRVSDRLDGATVLVEARKEKGSGYVLIVVHTDTFDQLERAFSAVEVVLQAAHLEGSEDLIASSERAISALDREMARLRFVTDASILDGPNHPIVLVDLPSRYADLSVRKGALEAALFTSRKNVTHLLRPIVLDPKNVFPRNGLLASVGLIVGVIVGVLFVLLSPRARSELN